MTGYYRAKDESDRDGAQFILRRKGLCASSRTIEEGGFAVCRQNATQCEAEGFHGYAELFTPVLEISLTAPAE